eukprot:TRINITY_DN5663_c0_g1_i4.p1 TRINITY_DN5663_c0_g1~~TRINITY_DN5663_c0_g1_i4.p1  ORF type:complete len:143 (+),score=38.36 TRINITY_DN5663_c0_g1_i4:155-583(+)
MCIRDRYQRRVRGGCVAGMAAGAGGFGDVRSILCDIKQNLQSAESRHSSLVKHWCTGSSGMEGSQLAGRLPVVPDTLHTPGSEQHGGMGRVTRGSSHQVLESMPDCELEELRHALESEICELESKLNGEPSTGHFTLVQSPP